MRQRIKLNAQGIVQGVGFRPYIYNLANKYRLGGFVLNSSNGVYIELEGEARSIDKFLNNFKLKSPTLSQIEEIEKEVIPVKGEEKFNIDLSKDEKDKFTLISPDIALCRDCVKELFQESNRRYKYPFINCTNCGPRFTIIKDIPYDRSNTTMDEFHMCDNCFREYNNYHNRRFHAQTVCCDRCGPELSLYNKKKERINTDKPIKKAAQVLKHGHILAIKGLGGYHLACDAYNDEVVNKLRNRKARPHKPFAIMVKDVEEAKNVCKISKYEEEILISLRCPIVLLPKKPSKISKGIALGLEELGIMLPYTPLHILLLQEFGHALVMTSGNATSESIIKDDMEAFKRLGNIADYFFTHNRKIYLTCDDSVLRIIGTEDKKKTYFIRRSRGYVPSPIKISTGFKLPAIAFGGHLKNVFCLTRDNYAFLSQYIGDLDSISTIKNFKSSLSHFIKIFSIKPEIVACDLHPEYTSSQLAKQYAAENNATKVIEVQHHHAHIVSCMAENDIYDKVIGVSWDGTGYGSDGAIWGGEFLIADRNSFERKAHLRYIPMPGGEKAIKEPWRMALSWIYKIYGEDGFNLNVKLLRNVSGKYKKNIKSMIDNNFNSPYTSSIGRLFSAISSILLQKYEESYEGESAIMLEHLARRGDSNEKERYNYKIVEKDKFIIYPDGIIKGVIEDIQQGIKRNKIAYKFHNTVKFILLDVCKFLRKETGLNKVVLSGGVFQNMLLLNLCLKLLKQRGFEVFIHSKVPTNDGGIALGQAVVANAKIS